MINTITIVGNLGADPEMRNTQGGPVCNLRVATTEKWKSRDGNMQERTEWHSVTVWGNQAEACAQYLSKGRQVYVQGRLQSREYEKDGVTRKVWDIVANKVQFLGGAQGGGNGGQQRGNQSGGGWGQSGQSQGQGQGGGWGQTQVDQQTSGGGWSQKKSGDDPIPF